MAQYAAGGGVVASWGGLVLQVCVCGSSTAHTTAMATAADLGVCAALSCCLSFSLPYSFFMDVKCPGCFAITTVFSHAQTVVTCQGCNTVLCQPTGGKARLTEGCGFRLKRG